MSIASPRAQEWEERIANGRRQWRRVHSKMALPSLRGHLSARRGGGGGEHGASTSANGARGGSPLVRGLG
eukprot:4032871-Prymnesium_polylepis.1